MPDHEPKPTAPAGWTGRHARGARAQTSQPAGASSAALRAPSELRGYLDLVLLALAVPVALALGAPTFGFAVGAGVWVLQRVLERTDRRWIARTREPGSRLGLDIAEAFGRIWLLAGGIVLAGAVGGRTDGLAAALTIFAAYSVAFAARLSNGREGFER